MIDYINYIQEDLKKSNLKNYNIQYYEIDESNYFFDFITISTSGFIVNLDDRPPIIECINAIIYIVYIEPKENTTTYLKSFDLDVNINKNSNSSVYKFLNPIMSDNNYKKINFFRVTYSN